jgi:hypothetical protein
MRKLFALAFVLAPALCYAQLPPAARVDRNIVAKYQLDSASYIYCVTGPVQQGPGTERVVTARASATSITVDSAVNLNDTAGFQFTYAHPSCGTGATDGWFIPSAGKHTVTIVYRQGDLTGGLDFDIETRTRSGIGTALRVLTGNIPVTTALINGTTVVLGETTNSFRVGLRYNTADPSDAGAAAEQIDVVLSTER